MNTRAAYERDVARVFGAIRKSISEITLRDVQNFIDTVDGAVNTKRRIISAIK